MQRVVVQHVQGQRSPAQGSPSQRVTSPRQRQNPDQINSKFTPAISPGHSPTASPQPFEHGMVRTVPTRTVEGGMGPAVIEDGRHMGPVDMGFQPIREDGQLPSRTPPRGAESPPKHPTAHRILVPQIG